MALSFRAFRRWMVPGGLLLLAECCRDDAYDKAIREQHEQAAAASEMERIAQEEARAQREQVEQAFESEPPAILSEDQLHQVLGYYCSDCHFTFPCGGCEWPGLYFDNVPLMISQRTVIPGNAEDSPVIQQMRQHRTPLPDGIPPASETAIKLVADFINQLPTSDASGQ